MSKILVYLILLGVIVNDVNSIPLPFRTLFRASPGSPWLKLPPHIQEEIDAGYNNNIAHYFPMRYANDDPSTADRRSLTNIRNSLGLRRSGSWESARYPWNRRGYVARRKDMERFPISPEERESKMPENMFPSEIETL